MGRACHKRLFIGISVFLWVAAIDARAAPQDGTESIRIQITGTAVPYREVLYALEKASDIFTFRVRRTPYTHGRTTEEVVLLTRSEWTRLITPLGEFAPSKRPKRGAGEVVYTVQHRTATERRRWIWDEALMGAQRDANAWLRTIRKFAATRLKPVTYWDDEIEHDASGLLLVSSQPNACLMVNSIPLGFSESYRSLRVSSGTHKVVFLRTDNGSSWPYSVQVKSGLTTRLEVELR